MSKRNATDEKSNQYLKNLGDRVRNYRAQRGITRKTMARDSGVSERYLAQLEQGHGNISILLLREIANALRIDIADMARDGPKDSVEFSLSIDMLRRLSPEDQKNAYDLINHHFADKIDNKVKICLIGLRGAGKTTLGTLLSEKLDIKFINLGTKIQEIAGMGINEIFSLSGQNGYRRYEYDALQSSLNEPGNAIIEIGGSLVSEAKSLNLMLNNSYTIWIQTSPKEHMQRVIDQGDTRPIKASREALGDLKRILAQRNDYYSKADAILNTSQQNIDQSLQQLFTLCAPYLHI